MILSIGEIVWDIFGDNKILGGAPLNVAYHLSTLGQEVCLISRIGSDPLADLATQQIAAIGLETTYVQLDLGLPTGQVTVTISKRGEPAFDIVAPAAWDEIDAGLLPGVFTDKPYHLVFGSLAQRSPGSRAAIRSLWKKASLRFYDVNLRPPFTLKETILDSLSAADVVKLNDAELDKVADWSALPPGPPEKRAAALFSRWNLVALAVTLGAKGAMLVSDDGIFTHPGFPVQVADTVGAGDAFFATLIDGIIKKLPWQSCLERANKRGSFVASRPGATPAMDNFKF
ncbi:MAG: carbohydrate kinase [Pseudomonadota bacterium]